MEVLSSSYSRTASPLSSGAVDGLAGAGAGARRRSVRRWPARPAPGPGRRGPRPRPWQRRRCPRTTRRSPPRVLTAPPLWRQGRNRTGSSLERALRQAEPCARGIRLGNSAAGAEQVQVQAVRGRRLAATHVHLGQRTVPSIALVGRLEPLAQILQAAHIHPRASRSAVIGLTSFTYKYTYSTYMCTHIQYRAGQVELHLRRVCVSAALDAVRVPLLRQAICHRYPHYTVRSPEGANRAPPRCLRPAGGTRHSSENRCMHGEGCRKYSTAQHSKHSIVRAEG